MSWKDRFTYNTKDAVEHQVGDNKLRFYPNRIGLLTELAEVSKPIAHAFGVLFSSNEDRTSTQKSFRNKPRKDTKTGIETAEDSVDEIVVEAVQPQIAKHRKAERDAAMDELIDGLTNEKNRLLLGRLLMDSLRDEFPYKKDRPSAEVEEFLFGDKNGDYHGLDAVQVIGLVTGWIKANGKVFGKAGEKMTALVQGRLEALPVASPLESETSTASGSSSKTPSLEPSASASRSNI